MMLDPSHKAQAVMVSLDFGTLHERNCVGYDKPNDATSDYELWSPHDGRHMTKDSCFMGQQTTYIRRKQDSQCFNGEDLEQTIFRKPCECQDYDYECDFGYVRNRMGDCVFSELFRVDPEEATDYF